MKTSSQAQRNTHIKLWKTTQGQLEPIAKHLGVPVSTVANLILSGEDFDKFPPAEVTKTQVIRIYSSVANRMSEKVTEDLPFSRVVNVELLRLLSAEATKSVLKGFGTTVTIADDVFSEF